MQTMLIRKGLAHRLLQRMILGFVAIACCQLSESCAAEETLVTVGGRPVTELDLQLEAVIRRVPADQIDQHRQRLLEELIDLRVMALFLERRRVAVSPIALDQQVERIHELIRRGDEEPDAFFVRIGVTEDQLRDRMSLAISWRNYVRQITTENELRQHYAAHRRELDGTQLRARHMILKAARDETLKREAAIEQLTELRRQIQSGRVSFSDAVAKHSEAPSRDENGDVGYFPYRGTMSADFANAAFALQVGELSQPIESAFGVHLIEITDERPGQLSLEDVREQVLDRISQALWSELATKERRRVPIQWANGAD